MCPSELQPLTANRLIPAMGQAAFNGWQKESTLYTCTSSKENAHQVLPRDVSARLGLLKETPGWWAYMHMYIY